MRWVRRGRDGEGAFSGFGLGWVGREEGVWEEGLAFSAQSLFDMKPLIARRRSASAVADGACAACARTTRWSSCCAAALASCLVGIGGEAMRGCGCGGGGLGTWVDTGLEFEVAARCA